jgi:hypothetical protein
MTGNGTGGNFGTSFNHTNSSLPDGTYTFKAWANDTLGNNNYTESIVFSYDATNPTASLGVSPVDNANSSSSSVTFDLKCSDNLGADNLQLWGNWSGSWAANQTNSSSFNNTFWNVTVTGISDGKYLWGVYCNDSAGNNNWTTNRTFTVDATPPTVSLVKLNASSASNYSRDNLNCYVNGTDNFDSNMSAYYRIYKNAVLNSAGLVENVSNNTEVLVSTVDSSSTSDGEVWKCSFLLNDGFNNATAWSNTSNLTIITNPVVDSGGSGGGGGSGPCLTNWVCTNWSSCNEGFSNRTCSREDARCLISNNELKPVELESCSIVSSQEEQENLSNFAEGFLAQNDSVGENKVIIFIGLIILLVGISVLYYFFKNFFGKAKGSSKKAKKRAK